MDGLIDQVHYADAASAVVAALQRAQAGDTLVAADDAPLTPEQICTVARLVSPIAIEVMKGLLSVRPRDGPHTRNYLEAGLASPTRTAILSGLLLVCIEADFFATKNSYQRFMATKFNECSC